MEPFAVPLTFSLWAGLVTLSSALERKVWHTTDRGNLYPNLYALLVGPAASGKTLPLHEGRRILEALGTHHLAPSNITRAAFVDELSESERHLVRPTENPSIINFNALAVFVNEFGTFIPAFETDFLSVLTDMWDGKGFSERKRKLKEKINIPESTVNILGACTPSFLRELLPDGAWEQGFMSRMILAYSGENDPQDLWSANGGQKERFDDLVHDLKIISELYGAIDYEDEALALIREWHMKGGPPKPDHPRLLTYASRRTAQLIKLCMVVSVAHTNALVITKTHFEYALAILLETERVMPDIFKSMRTGGDHQVMSEVWHYVYQYCQRKQRPMPAREVYEFVMERTPAHNISRLLEAMCRAGMLEEIKSVNEAHGYKARGRRE